MFKLIKRVFTIDNIKKFGKALTVIGGAIVQLTSIFA